MTKRKIEILAPAGSYESFHAALCAGADAVYVGGSRFGARAYADNFTQDELISAIDEAHLHGRKLYLTVNTLLKDSEMDELYDYLAPLYQTGLDAAIVQDMGVFTFIRENFPKLDLHASTQMTITGVEGARFIEAQGASRVVPARELSLKEIRTIREQTDLEIECFVHGALCYCYSGQCLLSSMIGGRSGNRGQCAQPCRLPYTINGEKKHFLSPKDICTLEIIPQLVDAGIDSFKIEGRMKKPEYTAAVTSMYRKYTDLFLKEGKKHYKVHSDDRKMLLDLYNRGGSSTGYYLMHNGSEMMSLNRPGHAGTPALKILRQTGREVTGKTLTELFRGDVIEIAGGKNNYTTGQGMPAGSHLTFLVAKNIRLKPGAILNRIRNESLIRRMHDEYVEHRLQSPVCGMIRIRPHEPASLTVKSRSFSYTALTAEQVQTAQNRPMDRNRILTQLKKTGSTDFFFKDLAVDLEGNVFLPVQQLNQLRRDALEGLAFSIKESFRRSQSEKFSLSAHFGKHVKNTEPDRRDPVFSVCARTGEQLKRIIKFAMDNPGRISRITLDAEFLDNSRAVSDNILKQITEEKICLTAALPPVFREEYEKYADMFLRIREHAVIDSVMIRNYGEYELVKQLGFDKNVILDHNLYVFNRYARYFWNRLGIRDFTAPLELNAGELNDMGIEDCELMVYGLLPVMISAQCIRKTRGECTGHPSIATMTDRTGCTYLAESVCSSCYNIIYDSRPLYLGRFKKEILDLSPKALNLRFVNESGDRTEKVLSLVKDTFSSKTKTNTPDFDYIQGHFARGVL